MKNLLLIFFIGGISIAYSQRYERHTEINKRWENGELVQSDSTITEKGTKPANMDQKMAELRAKMDEMMAKSKVQMASAKDRFDRDVEDMKRQMNLEIQRMRERMQQHQERPSNNKFEPIERPTTRPSSTNSQLDTKFT